MEGVRRRRVKVRGVIHVGGVGGKGRGGGRGRGRPEAGGNSAQRRRGPNLSNLFLKEEEGPYDIC